MKAQHGFTLLEMLAALTVLAVCSAVLLMAFGQAARSLKQVQASDRLSAAARSIIDEQADGPLQAGRRDGTWAGNIHWQLDIRQLPVAANRLRLFQLDLKVSEDHRQAHVGTVRVLGPEALQ
ncbi:type II secretion system protein [Pseudomonas sp.]|uniref:type II secretion system protein n=1 Tax=Pseudomonas sp. TaxID=306 RepID=UPI003CC5F29A